MPWRRAPFGLVRELDVRSRPRRAVSTRTTAARTASARGRSGAIGAGRASLPLLRRGYLGAAGASRARIAADHLQERRALLRRAERAPPAPGPERWPSTSTRKTYCHGAFRLGRDSMRVRFTPALSKSVSTRRSAPSRCCTPNASVVRSRPDGGASSWARTTKRVAFSRRSWMRRAKDRDVVQLGGDVGADGGGALVGVRLASGRRGRRRLHDLRAREVLRDPHAALRERLRMRVDGGDVRERLRAREQAVRDRKHVLLADQEIAFEERVRGHAHGALGRVLERDDAVVASLLCTASKTASMVAHSR